MNDFVVELMVRSLIVASLGLVVRYALIRSSAQARAAVLMVTAGVLALLPIAMILLPRLTVTVARHEVVEAIPSEAAPAALAPAFVFPWVLVWTAGAAVLAARVVISLYRFKKLEQGFAPASDSLTTRVKGFTQRARGVFFSPEGEPPMTWGVLQPKIALPTESENWIEPQLRSVVLHEDAHIRRRDWAVMIGFRVVTAVYWFNPLVWALQKCYELDSERAADDCVLAQGVDAPEYAGRLVEVAKSLSRPSKVPAVTMARTHRLNGRVAAILNQKTQRGMLKGWTRISVLGLLLVGGFAAGTVVPEIQHVRLSMRSTPKTAPIEMNIAPPSHEVKTASNADLQYNGTNADLEFYGDSDTPQPPVSTSTPSMMHQSAQPKTEPTKPRSVAPISANTGIKTSEVRADRNAYAMDGMDDMKIEVPDIDSDSIMKEVNDGLKEAQKEMDKASKDAEKDFKDAEREIDQTDMPEFARAIAKQSIASARKATSGLIKGNAANLKARQKSAKQIEQSIKDKKAAEKKSCHSDD